MDMWRILPVSPLLPKLDAPLEFDATSRELAEPQKLLPYLLQPEVSNLPSDIITVYVQAMIKIFGFWASELGQRWNDDELPDLRRTVISIQNRVGEFASCQDIEVQERVRSFCAVYY
jgi:AP-3 complex subunit delta-1